MLRVLESDNSSGTDIVGCDVHRTAAGQQLCNDVAATWQPDDVDQTPVYYPEDFSEGLSVRSGQADTGEAASVPSSA